MSEAKNVENLPARVGPQEHKHQLPSFLMPDSFEAITNLAEKFCAAKWVPKSYCDRNGNPDQAAVEVGIIAGLTIGMPPLSALQSIAVINGTPSLWGDGMLAMIRESGLLEVFDERMEKEAGKDGEGLVAFCTVKRRGENEQTRKFSQAMAKHAGLWDKAGPWKSYPQRMLQMRARSWALRDVFADVLKGMRSAEEMVDMGEVEAMPVPPMPKKPAEVATNVEVEEPDRPYVVTSLDGTETECTADEVVKALDFAMSECSTEDQLGGIWDSFGGSETLAKLSEEGRQDIIEQVNLTWQGQCERVAGIPPEGEREEGDLLGAG